MKLKRDRMADLCCLMMFSRCERRTSHCWSFRSRSAICVRRVSLRPQHSYLTSIGEKMWDLGGRKIEPSRAARSSSPASGKHSLSQPTTQLDDVPQTQNPASFGESLRPALVHD
eukprot:1068086-Rhodomonas_salina.3